MHAHQQHEQGDRGQQAVEQLGQVLCKIGVDLLHALAGQHDHLTGGHRLGVVDTQTGQLGINAAAQGALDVLGRLVAHTGRQHGKSKAQGHRAQTEHQVLPQGCAGQGAGKDCPQQPGNGPDKDHIAQHSQPLERYIGPYIAQGAPVKGQQFFIDHCVSPFLSCPHPHRTDDRILR